VSKADTKDAIVLLLGFWKGARTRCGLVTARDTTDFSRVELQLQPNQLLTTTKDTTDFSRVELQLQPNQLLTATKDTTDFSRVELQL
jgi:hypothetical protein